jgi:hypothetical protein
MTITMRKWSALLIFPGRLVGLRQSLVSARASARMRSTRGQALPLAVAALAVGALLVTPLLSGAATGSKAANAIGRRALERYSMDAGVEWSGWHLLSNPRLTADTVFSTAPLEPLPSSVNGAAFPATEIRYVAGAGAVESQVPAWISGAGDQCYTFSASEAGTVSARINVDGGHVWAALLNAADPCTRPAGLQPLSGSSPFGADVLLATPGTFKLLIGRDAATTGTIELSVPAATYEVRSVVGSRSVTARIVAGYSGVRIDSWQLN